MYSSIKEAFAPIAPVAVLVVIIQLMTGFMEPGMMTYWIVGLLLAGVGLLLFLRGVNVCLIPIGDLIGQRFLYMPGVLALIGVVFLVGMLACAADPAVAVLNINITIAAGENAPPTLVFFLLVVSGIGMLLVGAILRIIWNIHPAKMLGCLAGLVLLLSCFAPTSFVPLALDSGGVATGPLTVPFFLAIGLGFVSNIAGRSASSDGFGLLGIVYMGPILGVLLLGLFWGEAPEEPALDPVTQVAIAEELIEEVQEETDTPHPAVNPSFFGILLEFLNKGDTIITVLRGLVPLLLIGWLVGVLPSRVSWEHKIRLLKGAVWVLIGLIFFLQAVEVGFRPVADQLGGVLAGIWWGWALVPAGLLLGLCVGLAEPSVHVLCNQVEETTSGAIPKRLLLSLMAVGVALAAAVGMARIVCDIPILWIIIPGYLTIITLSYFSSRTFASIAYDAATVVTGPVLVTFMLVVAMGATDALDGRDRMTNGFGFVAIVAMVPVLVVMSMGVFVEMREKLQAKQENQPSLSEAETT